MIIMRLIRGVKERFRWGIMEYNTGDKVLFQCQFEKTEFYTDVNRKQLKNFK